MLSLKKAQLEDAPIVHTMQIKAFMPLLEKYQDFDMSPAMESIERVEERLKQDFTDLYLILFGEKEVGAIRVLKKAPGHYRVGPLFVIPAEQGKGIMQRAFQMLEELHSDAKLWELDTILQEKGNCHLYEKLGYKRTGEIKEINSNMTIVFYEKHI